MRELEDVPVSLAKGRHDDANDVDAIIEVLAKSLLLDLLLELPVARRDDARVEGNLGVAPHRAYRPLLQGAQELRLNLEGHVTDLVQKDRSAVRLDEETHALRLGVGEGAANVAEELALEERRRHRRAVDR
jgi:hypothetical protein